MHLIIIDCIVQSHMRPRQAGGGGADAAARRLRPRFIRPRSYRLEDLARAAGMSISGVRTAYDADEIAW